MNKQEQRLDIAKRLMKLPVEKKQALRQALQQKGINSWSLPIVLRSESQSDYPLSMSQRRLWFMEQYEEGSDSHNIAFAIDFLGDLDCDALSRAFEQLVARHHILRTTYHQTDSGAYQSVQDACGLIIPVLDVPQDSENWLEGRIEEISSRSFPLSTFPPIRLQLFRHGDCHHTLLIVVHHIAFDDASSQILVREVSHFYRAQLAAAQADLAPFSIQFGDYASWQQEWEQGEEYQKQANYWCEALAGDQEPLNLALDQKRGLLTERNAHLGIERLELDSDVYGRLQQFARVHDCSLYSLLLSFFGLLLQRHSDQSEINIGTSVSQRQRAELEPLIGFFVNTLVMPLKPGEDASYIDYLTQVNQTVKGALANQELPFDSLMELLKVERSSYHTALFQAFFVLLEADTDTPDLPGLTLEQRNTGRESARFDLLMRVVEDSAQSNVTIILEYASDLYSSARITSMITAYGQFIETVLAKPDVRLDKLVLAEANIAPLASQELVADTALGAFERVAITSPERVALVSSQRSLAYGPLNALAASWQAHFAPHAQSDVSVALLLSRGENLLIAMLASWKGGQPYLALDTKLPPARLSQILLDSQCRLVVGQGIRPDWLNADLAWLDTDNLPSEVVPELVTHRTPNIHPQDLAYIIFTSGSTGTPKAVGVSQMALANYVAAVSPTLALPEDAELLTLATVAADLGHTSVFGALLTGRRLRLIDDELAKDPQALAEALAERPVDLLKIVPSHLNALLSAENPQRLLPRSCLVLGGEGLNPELVKRIQALAPQCRIINHYGPTEATVGCLAGVVNGQVAGLSGFLSLGNALPGYQTLVLDKGLRPVPAGNDGELYISGPSLARGYLGKPDLTAERFIPNPFVTGELMYRTGDKVRLHTEGVVEFIGRIDQQVKIRGFRVELGEIEAWLKRQPTIKDAVVITTRGPGQNKQLLAYVVADGQDLNQVSLSQLMATELPDYMVLGQFIVLEELPLLANGKVNRKGLPKPMVATTASTNGVDASADSEISRQLNTIWCEVLGKESVLPNDNFFELGGDSILSLQVIAKARQQGLKLTPKQLFDSPTLGELAVQLAPKTPENQELIDKLSAIWCAVLAKESVLPHDNFFELGGDSILSLQVIAKARQQGLKLTPKQLFEQPTIAALVPILSEQPESETKVEKKEVKTPSGPLSGVELKAQLLADFDIHIELAPIEVLLGKGITLEDLYPLSPLQQGLLFHAQLSPEDGANLNQVMIEITGPVDLRLMKQAWQQTVAAHPGLRTGFMTQQLDTPLQFVQSHCDLPWQALDWSDLSDAEQKTSLDDFCKQDRARGFDLTQAPLMRVAMIKVTSDAWWLVSTRHHIVFDGWCTALMFEDVFGHYLVLHTGAPREQSTGPAYKSYISWIHQQDKTRVDNYWRENLGQFTAPTPLPGQTSTKREGVDFRYFESQLGQKETQALVKLAARNRVTLNSLMQAAWSILLSRYCGQQDVVFGVVCAGRPSELPDSQKMIGLCVNSLPLKLTPHKSLQLSGYLTQVQAANSAMREFEYSSLVEVKALSQVPQSMPLFDSLFVFQNLAESHSRVIELDGFSFKQMKNRVQTNYSLNLEIVPGECLGIDFSYDHGVIPAEAIQRLASQFRELLKSMVAQPEACLSELNILSASQEIELLHTWNQTGQERPLDKDMLSLFETQVEHTPDAMAAVFCDGAGSQLTYFELNRQANQLAHWLIKQGVGKETLVALSLEREPRLLVSLLAIQKAGGGYLPIDPSHPAERKQYVLEHGAPVLLLTSAALQPELVQVSPKALPVVVWEQVTDELKQQSEENPGLTVDPEQLAYTLYTSGSTGKPKGVQISRGAFVNFLHAMQAQVELNATDKLLAVTTLSFDIAGLELFLPLITGGQIVVASREQAMDAEALLALLETHRISIMQATPATWTMLVSQPASLNTNVWSGLKVLCGGEALPAKLAEELLAKGVALLNVYGPTETTVWSSSKWITTDDIGIGIPIQNNHFYILDDALRPVPIGVAGDLYIGGLGLARGYLRRPELTADVFIPNPFGPDNQQPGAGDGSRLYRTGDVARYNTYGGVEYLGRSDFQVKVRGFRIELGEIEGTLDNHPKVKQTVVVAHQDNNDQACLAAYFTLNGQDTGDQKTLDRAELADYLQARLPSYMVPESYTLLDRFELNSNGKVDRKALPAPEVASSRGQDYAAPEGDLEQRLAAIWIDLLPVSRVGRLDNFFELGGHSLLATRVVSQVRSELNKELSLKALFASPVLADLASLLSESKFSEQPPLFPVSREQPLPLSYAQQSLWLVEQMRPGGSAYNIKVALSIQGDLNIGLLEESLARLVQRHEVLRTTYHATAEEPVQVIHANLKFKLEIDDLQALIANEKQHKVNKILAEEENYYFDLSSSLMLRARVLILAADDVVLSLSTHHIASDAWSMGVMTNDLVAIYSALLGSQEPDLPELAVQYADYALWQRGWLQGEALARQVNFWRQNMAACPPLLKLPLDFSRPKTQSYQGDSVNIVLPQKLVSGLGALANDSGASLFMLLLAGFNLTLYKQAGLTDIVLGTDLAGRTQTQLEDLIGFFVNVLPLRTKINDADRFSELLDQVKETSLAAFAHQDLPFDLLIDALRPERNSSYNPVVQALFVMQNAPEGELELPGVRFNPLESDGRESKFDLALFITEEDQEVSMDCVYTTGLFKRKTIEALLTGFRFTLQQIVSEPNKCLNAFELFNESEKKQMAVDKTKRKGSKIGKLKKVKPRMAAPVALVKTSFLEEGKIFPVVVQPTTVDLDASAWAEGNREYIQTLLHKHAGILFRDFPLKTPQDFESFAKAICPELYGEYGDLPKKDGGDKIYKSTPYPEDQMILYHNESSHLHKWPTKQWFFSEVVAPVGGQTPIVDCREMYRLMPAEMLKKLEKKQLLYVRNFTQQLDVSWQDFFKTGSKEVVEEKCRQEGMEYEWLGEDELQTRTLCPAVITHPVTAEKSFFNQIQLHHIYCLEAEVREDLLDMVGLQKMPRNVYYGDGTPIEDHVVETISRLYEECAIRFRWQQGDLIMVDNMLAAHARDPFVGPRKIVVAMGDMFTRNQLAEVVSE
ncbi:MAG: amino acid adenylation domain-containing protein [Cycloclasticus sp.]